MKYQVKSRFRFLTFVVAAIIVSVIFCNFLLGTGLEVEADTRINYTTIEVCAGDNLWDIADAYMPDDMDLRDAVYELRELNGMSGTDVLKAGDKLVVPEV